MFSFFNPFKTVAGMLSTTMTLLLLAYTHTQAFRLGLGISQNPMAHMTAAMLGLVPPQKPCPNPTDESMWDKMIPFKPLNDKDNI